jgi:hypothetical protein
MLHTSNSLSAEFAKVSPEKANRRRFGFISLEAASPRSANPSPSHKQHHQRSPLKRGLVQRNSAINLFVSYGGRSEIDSPRSPSARLVEAAVNKVLYESPVKAGSSGGVGSKCGAKGALSFTSIGVSSWDFDDDDDGDSLVDPTAITRGAQQVACPLPHPLSCAPYHGQRGLVSPLVFFFHCRW